MSGRPPVLALVGLAFLVRVGGLTAQSLWYDEAVSWLYASGSLAALFRWLPGDNHPPGYFVLLWAWMRLAGSSEYALRFLSTVWATLLLPLSYVLGVRLAGPRVGLLGTLLLAVSPWAAWYAHETRMYAQLAALLVAATYFLIRGWWPAYLAATSAALHTHYFAWLYLPYHAGLAAFQRRLRRWGPAAAVAVLLFLPWLPDLVARMGSDATYWPGSLSPATVVWQTLRAYALGERLLPERAWPLALPAAALAAAGLLLLPRGGKRLGLMVLLPMALLAAISYQRPKFDPRYLIPSLPAYLLLASGGITALAGLRGGWESLRVLRARAEAARSGGRRPRPPSRSCWPPASWRCQASMPTPRPPDPTFARWRPTSPSTGSPATRPWSWAATPTPG